MLKKGAMFGLESRALKKQFVKLFLERMQSVIFKKAHGARMKTKRGAMFGLDARIALAIFGSLSVISGAALYSAIQQAKVISTFTDIVELEKAVEAYILDTGQDLPIYPSSVSYDYNHLITKPTSVIGWKGPYYSLPIKGNYYSQHKLGNLIIRDMKEETGGPETGMSTCESSPCYYWIQLNASDPQLTSAIDLYVDGVADVENGKIRVLDVDPGSVYYKTSVLVLKQP